MEERNRSDAIPLPKWESFRTESNEPGRDFPAGPYNRMIAKLYGTSVKPLENIDISTMDNTSFILGLTDREPMPSVLEGMKDKTPVQSFAGDQLMHRTRPENELSRFGPAVSQHTEGSRQDDRMSAKLYGTDGKPLENIDISRMDNTSSMLGLADRQPMPSVLEGMKDKTPVKSFAGDQLMHKTRQEDGPSRFVPAVSQQTEGSRQEDRTIAESYRTASKPLEYSDISRMENTSFRLGSADGQPVSEGRMDKTAVRSISGGQLMHKTKQEEGPSRFGPAVTQQTEESRHDNEPVRSGPVEPKNLADKTRLDIGLIQSVTGDDHPADKVSATVVSAGGQLKDLADKVKLDGAPAGVIFMCNRMTKEICFRYGLFGLPAIQLKLVQRIVPGTKLFLFVLESRELYGIFEASSNGGFNLEPLAFGASFPSQVRFRICRLCRPLREKDFRKAIEDNYFQHNKFKNELSSQQVLNLLQLFCPEGFPDEKEQKHENLMLNHTHAFAKKDGPVSDPAESQSELSMEISSQDPQSSPEKDSHQSPHSALFKESHMGGQLSVMDASRDYRAPFKDVPAVSGQDPMGDRIRMRGLHSIPIEGSRHYYSPSVDGPMLSKSPYMGVMGGSQKSLTEETRLTQPSLDRFQRDSTVFLRETSGESHQPMVDVRARTLGKTPIEGGHDIYADERHYFSSSRVANDSYSLDAKDNYRNGALYGSGLQRYGSGAQYHILSEEAEEKGKFPVKDNLQDSMHRSYAPNTNLQSWDSGVSGQRFSDADVERGKFLSHDYLEASDHHILSEQAEEKGKFPVKDNLQDSMLRSYAPNTNLQSRDSRVSGQRFSDAGVERGKFLSHAYLEASDHHISRSQLWPRAEVTGSSIEQNMFLQSNPIERGIYTSESDGLTQEQAEHLARIRHMYKQDQQRSQENIVFNDSRDLPDGWVDASSFHSHKRVSEDPVDNASNPVKRRHYHSESHGDIMSDERAHFVNGALGGEWMGNFSWAGSNKDKS